LQIHLFAPIFPEQFHHSPDVTYKRRGEVALMYAVLDDAITCFQNGSFATARRAQRLAREAEAWFFAEDPAWIFSFVNICAVLGLDPDYIRLGLRRWRQRCSAPATPQQQRRRATPGRPPRQLSALTAEAVRTDREARNQSQWSRYR
jgi:hypothetical protein